VNLIEIANFLPGFKKSEVLQRSPTTILVCWLLMDRVIHRHMSH
jgi:hypothetical protein